MDYFPELEDSKIIDGLIRKLKRLSFGRKIKIMEVCGTHTMSIFKYGIKDLLPSEIDLISGPGCPVCVTPESYIDNALLLAEKENLIVVTFADLLRVPGKNGSLEEKRACGADIRLVYSPLEAVNIALTNPEKEVVFLAIGFETTIPAICLGLKKAKEYNLKNFSILQSLKIMPPVLKVLLSDKELKIDAFLLPGHVSTIIGAKAFSFLEEDYDTAAVIAGFEAVDILAGLYLLCNMLLQKEKKVVNLYQRAVQHSGNREAVRQMFNFLTTTNSYWRGLGLIKDSGMELKKRYSNFSAEKKFGIEIQNDKSTDSQCICGEILKGKKKPPDCPLFLKGCTPVNPVGACMVSLEGTCAAYFRYYYVL